LDPPRSSELTWRQRAQLSALLSLGIAPYYLNGLYNAPLAEHGREWFWAAELVTWIVLPIIVLGTAIRLGLLPIESLGLHTRLRGRSRPGIVLVLVVIVPFVFLRLDLWVAQWARMTLPPGWPTPPFNYRDALPPPGPDTGWWRLLALLHFCVSAGLVEELYYRAAFDRLFPRGWLPAIAYVITSSIVFTGAHWEGGLPNLAEALTIGLAAATLFRATQNLWPLVIAHIAIDWYWLTAG
jgi:membrane protease YdiL (CAAX protease family)